MFDGDRIQRLTIAGAVLFAFVVAGLVLGLNYNRQHIRDRDEAAVHSTNSGPDKASAECTRDPKSGVLVCVMRSTPSNGDAKYAEHDLRAQQDMAEWAFAMFWASVAGVFATVVGIYYVAATLEESRKATGAAIQVIEMKRAWIVWEKMETKKYLGRKEDPEAQDTYSFWVEWKNYGGSPARLTDIVVGVIHKPKGEPVPSVVEDDWKSLVKHTSTRFAGPGQILHTDKPRLSDVQWKMFMHDKQDFYLYSRCVYKTAIDEVDRVSEVFAKMRFLGWILDERGVASGPNIDLEFIGPQNQCT